MATLIQVSRAHSARIALNRKRDKFIEKLIPRPCMIVSGLLVLAGLVIPLLMLAQVLQVNFLLGLGSLALIAAGSILALVFCGEI